MRAQLEIGQAWVFNQYSMYSWGTTEPQTVLMSAMQSLLTSASEQSESVERHHVPRLAGEMLSGVSQ
jgi:hypothetical protein